MRKLQAKDFERILISFDRMLQYPNLPYYIRVREAVTLLCKLILGGLLCFNTLQSALQITEDWCFERSLSAIPKKIEKRRGLDWRAV